MSIVPTSRRLLTQSLRRAASRLCRKRGDKQHADGQEHAAGDGQIGDAPAGSSGGSVVGGGDFGRGMCGGMAGAVAADSLERAVGETAAHTSRNGPFELVFVTVYKIAVCEFTVSKITVCKVTVVKCVVCMRVAFKTVRPGQAFFQMLEFALQLGRVAERGFELLLLLWIEFAK